MIPIIAMLLIIINVILPKSKYTYYPLLIFAWLLMAFTYDIADENVYFSRYNNPELWIGNTELMFSLSTLLFHWMGCSFVQYKAVMSAVGLLLINSTIRRYAKYPNLVLVLYFLCPFALNVAQFRNALATAVFVYGVRFLIEDNSPNLVKKIPLTLNDLKYIFTIILASMFHSAAFIWMFLLIAKKYSIKANIGFVLIVNIMIIFILTPSNIGGFIPAFGAAVRMAAYLSVEYAQSGWHHYSQIVLVLWVGLLTTTFAYFRLKQIQKIELDYYRIEYMLKSNVSIMIILGVMVMYTQEVYRLQEGLSIINYILITNCISKRKFGWLKMSKRNFKIVCTSFAYVLVAMYIEIFNYLISDVLIPILSKNYLFDCLLN